MLNNTQLLANMSLVCQLCTFKKEHEPSTRAASTSSSSPTPSPDIDPAELKKIKKVQVPI